MGGEGWLSTGGISVRKLGGTGRSKLGRNGTYVVAPGCGPAWERRVANWI
jgi:hypothetical protein